MVMKKWVVLLVAITMVSAVQAGEKGKEKGPTTKEQFIAAQQKRAEKAGKEFDQAKVEAQFAKMDKNSDGVLTADEMVPAKKAKKPAAEDEGSDEE
jgi:Ca2+-binding EF-hand superfamily protein